uniref:DUF834 domain-containing protein n=1 Tax=Oryza sativa subsp. japonica TaxID=39947 RepID=Q8S5F5_ORYSJ|nr:Hypothetical protein [Oryza sativa Japonica Group]
MGAAVAGEPRHNNANGGHREREGIKVTLTTTYATTNGNGRWPATSFEGRRATTEGWPGFTSQLRIQWRQRRSLAMTGGAAGLRRRSKRDSELRVDGDDGALVDFGFGEMAAGLLLTAAMLTVDTARSGDHGVDGKASPEIKTWQRFGLHGDGDFRRERVAGVELFTAKPREVAALTGDGRGDAEWRLERRPEVEREGERGESDSGDGGRWDLRG